MGNTVTPTCVLGFIFPRLHYLSDFLNVQNKCMSKLMFSGFKSFYEVSLFNVKIVTLTSILLFLKDISRVQIRLMAAFEKKIYYRYRYSSRFLSRPFSQ